MYINDISAVSVYSESLKFYKVSVPRRTPREVFYISSIICKAMAAHASASASA